MQQPSNNGNKDFIKGIYEKAGGAPDKFDVFKQKITSDESFRKEFYDKLGGAPDKFSLFSDKILHESKGDGVQKREKITPSEQTEPTSPEGTDVDGIDYSEALVNDQVDDQGEDGEQYPIGESTLGFEVTDSTEPENLLKVRKEAEQVKEKQLAETQRLLEIKNQVEEEQGPITDAVISKAEGEIEQRTSRLTELKSILEENNEQLKKASSNFNQLKAKTTRKGPEGNTVFFGTKEEEEKLQLYAVAIEDIQNKMNPYIDEMEQLQQELPVKVEKAKDFKDIQMTFGLNPEGEEMDFWESGWNSTKNALLETALAPNTMFEGFDTLLSFGDKGIKAWAEWAGLSKDKELALRKVFGMVTDSGAVPSYQTVSERRASNIEFINQNRDAYTNRVNEYNIGIADDGTVSSSLLNTIGGAWQGAMGFVPSLAIGASTAGVGFIPWVTGMESASMYDIQKEVTGKELIDLLEDSDVGTEATSLMIGALTGSLERYGFTKMTQFLRGLNRHSAFVKNLMVESGRQGPINWLEAGLTKYGELYAEAKSKNPNLTEIDLAEEVGKEATEWLISEEGRQAGYKAIGGSLIFGGLKGTYGLVENMARNKDYANQYDEALDYMNSSDYYRDAFKEDVQLRIEKGQLTQKEGNRILGQMNENMSIAEELEAIDDVSAKKKAFKNKKRVKELQNKLDRLNKKEETASIRVNKKTIQNEIDALENKNLELLSEYGNKEVQEAAKEELGEAETEVKTEPAETQTEVTTPSRNEDILNKRDKAKETDSEETWEMPRDAEGNLIVTKEEKEDLAEHMAKYHAEVDERLLNQRDKAVEDGDSATVEALEEELDRRGTEFESRLGEMETEDITEGEPVAEEIAPDVMEGAESQEGLDGERAVEAEATSKVRYEPVSNVQIDAKRFQYKEGTDVKTGTSTKLKGVSKFNDDLAGAITVWKDPKDGQTYVINGHHRLELAQRSGVENIAVKEIEADNASEARKLGALQNIAEGMGSPVDAAKVFRETDTTKEILEEEGLALTESVASKGLALSSLEDGLFDMVAQGEMKENVGVIIGNNIKDTDKQLDFYNTVVKGSNLSQKKLEIAAKYFENAQKQGTGQVDLFGNEGITTTGKALIDVVDAIRSKIVRTKNVLKSTANNQELLEEFGNKIVADKTKGASEDAKLALMAFDQFGISDKQLVDLTNEAAQKVNEGQSVKKTANEYTERVIERAIQVLEEQFKGTASGSSKSGSSEQVRAEQSEEVQSPPKQEQTLTTPTIVAESEAKTGQYFTRDIGGDVTVYERTKDGRARMLSEAEGQQVLDAQQEQTAGEAKQTSKEEQKKTPKVTGKPRGEAKKRSEKVRKENKKADKDVSSFLDTHVGDLKFSRGSTSRGFTKEQWNKRDKKANGEEITKKSQLPKTLLGRLSKVLLSFMEGNNIKLVWHTSADSMMNAIADFNDGQFVSAEGMIVNSKEGEGKEVHIFSGGRAMTIVHEVFHPLVTSMIKNNKPAFDSLLETLRNSRTKDAEAAREFVDKLYDKDTNEVKEEELATEGLSQRAVGALINVVYKQPGLIKRMVKRALGAIGMSKFGTKVSLDTLLDNNLDYESFGEQLGKLLSQQVIITGLNEVKNSFSLQPSVAYDYGVTQSKVKQGMLEMRVNDGVAYFKDRENPITGEKTGEVELDFINVPKNSRGNKIGARLLDKFLSYTDKIGLPVYLMVDSRFGTLTQQELIELYERRGFVSQDLDIEMVRQPNAPRFSKTGEQLGEVVRRNNGNPMSKTPDGKESKLYQDILALPEVAGDTQRADEIKAQVYSDNFRDWFGDWQGEDKTDVSKVVDENGEPLMVYHGTNDKFTEFKKQGLGKRKSIGLMGDGFYFTLEKQIAKDFGENVIPAFVSVTNILDFAKTNNKEIESIINDSRELRGKKRTFKLSKDIDFSKMSTIEAAMAYKDYSSFKDPSIDAYFMLDGFKNEYDKKENQLKVNKPNQIKSVFNEGQFGRETNDIRFSRTPFQEGQGVTKEEAEANFNRWKRGNKLVEGSEVQDVKTGTPIVARAYHGTTNDFYEFDSSIKGNVEGHLGRVNYFTTDYQDASSNYQADGADLTGRIEIQSERIEDDIRIEFGVDEAADFTTTGIEGDKIDKGFLQEVFEFFNYNIEVDDYIAGDDYYNVNIENLARHIAKDRLDGGREKVLDLYIKLNNPVVLGQGATWFDTLDIDKESLDEAAKELAGEYDMSPSEVLDDMYYEVVDRAMLNEGYENKVVTALQTALFNNGYESSEAFTILEDNFYDMEVDLNKLEQTIRKSELYDNLDGELASSQVIADFFKGLGFDGIILTDVAERFRNMGLGGNTSHIHVFDEYNNQIKLADGSNVTFGDSPDIRFSRTGAPAESFYSNANRAIEGLQLQPSKPEVWVKKVAEAGGRGTKQELEWIGLEDYLNEWMQENNAKSVPKEVVEQYIKDNQIEIVEVTKGGLEGRAENITDRYNKITNSNKNVREVFSTLEVIIGFKKDKETYDRLRGEELKEVIADYTQFKKDREESSETKYSEYTLEGGENYREVLLTLPNNKGQDYAEKMRNKYGRDLDPMQIYEKMSESEKETQAKLNNESEVTYKSSHWDESNVLAHIRLNERTLPNGERVMFIEEIQSDWAQEGKKKGFKKQEGVPTDRDLQELSHEEVLTILETNDPNGEWREGEYGAISKEEGIEYIKEWMEESDSPSSFFKDIANIDGVAQMPYKKTDQWVGMSIRRALQMAAMEGFDRIAWVTGEQIKKVVGGNLEGQKYFYDKLLPKVAKKEAKRFDKKAKVEVIDFTKKEDIYDAVVEELSPRDQIEEVGEGTVINFKSPFHRPNANMVISDGQGGFVASYKAESGRTLKTYKSFNAAKETVLSSMEKDIKPFKRYVATVNGVVNKDGIGGRTREEAIANYKKEKVLKGGVKNKPSKQLSIPITSKMRGGLSSGIPMFSRTGTPESVYVANKFIEAVSEEGLQELSEKAQDNDIFLQHIVYHLEREYNKETTIEDLRNALEKAIAEKERKESLPADPQTAQEVAQPTTKKLIPLSPEIEQELEDNAVKDKDLPMTVRKLLRSSLIPDYLKKKIIRNNTGNQLEKISLTKKEGIVLANAYLAGAKTLKDYVSILKEFEKDYANPSIVLESLWHVKVWVRLGQEFISRGEYDYADRASALYTRPASLGGSFMGALSPHMDSETLIGSVYVREQLNIRNKLKQPIKDPMGGDKKIKPSERIAEIRKEVKGMTDQAIQELRKRLSLTEEQVEQLKKDVADLSAENRKQEEALLEAREALKVRNLTAPTTKTTKKKVKAEASNTVKKNANIIAKALGMNDVRFSRMGRAEGGLNNYGIGQTVNEALTNMFLDYLNSTKGNIVTARHKFEAFLEETGLSGKIQDQAGRKFNIFDALVKTEGFDSAFEAQMQDTSNRLVNNAVDKVTTTKQSSTAIDLVKEMLKSFVKSKGVRLNVSHELNHNVSDSDLKLYNTYKGRAEKEIDDFREGKQTFSELNKELNKLSKDLADALASNTSLSTPPVFAATVNNKAQHGDKVSVGEKEYTYDVNGWKDSKTQRDASAREIRFINEALFKAAVTDSVVAEHGDKIKNGISENFSEQELFDILRDAYVSYEDTLLHLSPRQRRAKLNKFEELVYNKYGVDLTGRVEGRINFQFDLAAADVALDELLEQYYVENKGKDLVPMLQERVGLTSEQAKAAQGKVKQILDTQVRAKAEEYLAKYINSRKSVNNAIDFLTSGVTNLADFENAFGDEYNFANLNTAQQQEFSEMLERFRNARLEVDKKNAVQDMQEFLLENKRETWVQALFNVLQSLIYMVYLNSFPVVFTGIIGAFVPLASDVVTLSTTAAMRTLKEANINHLKIASYALGQSFSGMRREGWSEAKYIWRTGDSSRTFMPYDTRLTKKSADKKYLIDKWNATAKALIGKAKKDNPDVIVNNKVLQALFVVGGALPSFLSRSAMLISMADALSRGASAPYMAAMSTYHKEIANGNKDVADMLTKVKQSIGDNSLVDIQLEAELDNRGLLQEQIEAEATGKPKGERRSFRAKKKKERKRYIKNRRPQLRREFGDAASFETGDALASEYALMQTPQGILGNMSNWLLSKTNPNLYEQDSILSQMIAGLVGTTLSIYMPFVLKVGVNFINFSLSFTPYNLLKTPIHWAVKKAAPQRADFLNPDLVYTGSGKKQLDLRKRDVVEKSVYYHRALLGTLSMMIAFGLLFNDEEDEDGNYSLSIKMDENGKPIQDMIVTGPGDKKYGNDGSVFTGYEPNAVLIRTDEGYEKLFSTDRHVMGAIVAPFGEITDDILFAPKEDIKKKNKTNLYAQAYLDATLASFSSMVYSNYVNEIGETLDVVAGIFSEESEQKRQQRIKSREYRKYDTPFRPIAQMGGSIATGGNGGRWLASMYDWIQGNPKRKSTNANLKPFVDVNATTFLDADLSYIQRLPGGTPIPEQPKLFTDVQWLSNKVITKPQMDYTPLDEAFLSNPKVQASTYYGDAAWSGLYEGDEAPSSAVYEVAKNHPLIYNRLFVQAKEEYDGLSDEYAGDELAIKQQAFLGGDDIYGKYYQGLKSMAAQVGRTEHILRVLRDNKLTLNRMGIDIEYLENKLTKRRRSVSNVSVPKGIEYLSMSEMKEFLAKNKIRINKNNEVVKVE